MISNLSIRQRFKHVPLITGLLFALPFSHMALSADVVKPAPKPVIKCRLTIPALLLAQIILKIVYLAQ